MFGLLMAALSPASSALLVVDGMPIGSFDGRKWNAINERKPDVPDLTFHEIGFRETGRTRPLADVVYSEGTGVWAVIAEANGDFGGALLCGRKPVWPRKVGQVALDSAAYVTQVKAFLTKNSMGYVKPRLTRISSIDLDGDGVKEVIVESSSRDAPAVMDVTRSDYSVILLNHLVKGKLKTEVVAFDGNPVKNGMTTYHSVRGIADLDGDGVMEFVTTSAYYEGSEGTLWRWKGGKLLRLAENFAGV